MQEEGKGNIANNKDVEEYSPKRADVYKSFIIVIILLLLNIAAWSYWGGLNFVFGLTIFPIIILPILILDLIGNFYKEFEKIIISKNEIGYSSLFGKIDSNWKDISKIEIITHKQKSEQTGLIISSTTEYIIHTLKRTFSLKEGGVGVWDYTTIRKVYDKIVSKVPDFEIIQREVEHIVGEGGGKG